MIPFLDLKSAYHELKSAIDSAVLESLDNAHYILGDEVSEFEKNFSDYIGTEHCVTVGSGLDALSLALQALGISDGDEVIVPAHTFVATWFSVTQSGGVPIPVDCDENSFIISAAAVRSAITENTKAIVVVSLYGEAAVDSELRSLATEVGIPLVEDAAQAHGAATEDGKAGSLSDIAAWSFYPAKNLGAMDDGGAITTNDPKLADTINLMRNYGSRTKYYHESFGINSRLGSLQASILTVKLRFLDEWNQRRVDIADFYLQNLDGANLLLPTKPALGNHVWHLFVVRHPDREKLQSYLADNKVQTAIHYPVAPYQQKCYQYLGYDTNQFPVASSHSQTVLSLPIGPHLSLDDAEKIVSLINRF